MYRSLTIEEFHALLSEQNGSDSPLMSLVGKLTDTETPEDIVKRIKAAIVWTDWRAIEP